MKLKKKLLKKELTFSEYIRNYSNNINKGRFKILKKIGIPKNKISDINVYRKYSKTVIDYIKKTKCPLLVHLTMYLHQPLLL